MATHSSLLAWRIPMNRGAWQVPRGSHKESDMTEWLSTAQNVLLLICIFILLIVEGLILNLQWKNSVYLLKKLIVVYNATICNLVLYCPHLLSVCYHTFIIKKKIIHTQKQDTARQGQHVERTEVGRLVNISLGDSPLFPSAHINFTSSAEEQTDPQSIFCYLPALLFRNRFQFLN